MNDKREIEKKRKVDALPQSVFELIWHELRAICLRLLIMARDGAISFLSYFKTENFQESPVLWAVLFQLPDLLYVSIAAVCLL